MGFHQRFCLCFFPVALPYSGSAFGRRVQPAEYGGLICQGTELSLQQCAVSSSFVRTWSKLFFSNERDYAGVKCTPKEICKIVLLYLTTSAEYMHDSALMIAAVPK